MIKGVPHGYVRVIYSNQNYYEGKMIKDKYNGLGTLYLKNGTKIDGYW